MTSDIWTYSASTLLAWTAAYAVYEPMTYIAYPYLLQAKTVQEYYNPKRVPFAIVAFGDYIYSTFLFLVALAIVPIVFGISTPKTVTDWCLRLALFFVVQWTGDFAFYQIIQRVPPFTRYIDFFQRYTKEVSIGALIGDSLYGIGWFLLTQWMASYASEQTMVTILALFLFGTLVVSY
jgi:hypothetical protein